MERGPGLDIVCTDLQAEMLAEMPDQMDRVGGDKMALPFADGSFDVVHDITAMKSITTGCEGTMGIGGQTSQLLDP
jgi:ubiquinone/menaquinone biosynthesis C-methylase UbiE